MTDITIYRDKLILQLKNTGWDFKMRFFLTGSEFENILLNLWIEIQEGRRFTPPIRDIFKVFEHVKLNDVKVIFLNKEPYPDPTLNTGFALMHTQKTTTDHGFSAMINELNKTVGEHSITSGDLYNWIKQGVLLLNTSLTTQVLKSGKHDSIWEPFTIYLMDVLNQKENLIWVILGDNKYHKYVKNPTHKTIMVPDLPNERKGIWESGNVFNRVNGFLVENNISAIVW